MRGWEGAWCLSSFRCASLASRHPDESDDDEDRHQAPTSTPPCPLSHQSGRAFNRIPDFGCKCSQNEATPHYGSKASSLSLAVSNCGQSGLIPGPFWVSQQMWYDRGENRRGWMESPRLAHHPTLDRR